MTENGIKKLLSIVARLESLNIFFWLSHNQDDAIMIEAVVPGQRWEIEVFEDSTLELEVFRSDGLIVGERELEELIARQELLDRQHEE